MTTKVAEAMHGGVEWISPDTCIPEIARIMRDKDIGAIPVGQNDRLVGMVTDRDVAVRGLTSDGDTALLTAADVMTKPIVYCMAEQPIEDAVRLMEALKIRRLPVVDREKRMVGMLSIGDVCHCGQPDLAVEVMSAVSSHHS